MTGLPFPDVPVRPLRAQRTFRVMPRSHKHSCPHAWVYVNPPKWTDEQCARAHCTYDGPRWVYTPDCAGCEDLIAHHQTTNARWIKRNA